MSLKWLEIFRPGKHTASNGIVREYSTEELKQVVDHYNPAHFKAPLIVSYPAHNTAGYADGDLWRSQLAFGFPEKLRLVGDRLQAGFAKIDNKVKEWIDNGNILGFSASFYLPESPYNPYPGKLSLRHVAGCGIDPPAVKGMASPEFGEPLSHFANYSEDQSGTVDFSITDDVDEETLEQARLGVKVYQQVKAIAASIDFGEYGMSGHSIAQIFKDFYQRHRDMTIADKGLEMADQMYPSYALNVLNSIVSQPAQMPATWDEVNMLQQQIDKLEGYLFAANTQNQDSYSYQEEDNEVNAETQAKLDALIGRVEHLETENSNLRQARERDRVTSFVEGLARDRKVHPNEKAKEIEFILSLPHSETVDYGEAGAMTQRDAYMRKLNNNKPLWSDKELPIGTDQDPGFSELNVDFALPDGCEIDRESAALYRKAAAYCQQNGLDVRNTADLLQAAEAVSHGRY